METELQQMPLDKLMLEYATLEKELDMKLMRYEELRAELVRRYPPLEDELPRSLIIKEARKTK